MTAVIGADALSRRFKAISGPQSRRAFFRDYGLQTQRIAKLKLRRHNKTGNTTRSGSVDVRGDRVRVEFGGAAVFLERGTRPHRIQARRGKALRFAAGAGGRRLSGSPRRGADVTFVTLPRYVNHPGTKASPFLLPAAQAALKSAGIDSHIVKAWNDAA